MSIETTAPTLDGEAFAALTQRRFSARRFLPQPLAPEEIRAVLEDAQRAPSNSNSQPWWVHVVSGDRQEALSRRLLEADDAGRMTPDYTYDYSDFGEGAYLERVQHHAATLYSTQGIERGDQEGRRSFARRNLEFFGAPHVALLFMPSLGDNVRAAGDLGMYGQNFLLSLAARGYAGIPQTMLGFYAQEVRETLGISEEMKLLFGISFGVPDSEEPLNQIQMSRVPLGESVVLHDTPGVLEGPSDTAR